MTGKNALHALATFCGIADEHADIWGNLHLTSDTTRKALLTAMGLPVHDTDPARIQCDLENAEWLRQLPPVAVVRCNEPIRIELTVPVRLASSTLNWALKLESGATQKGTCEPKRLSLIGKRRVVEAEFSRHTLELFKIDEPGYHKFVIERPDGSLVEMPVIVVPTTCYQPKAIRDGVRVWGLAVQFYGLRSRRNWGIGDFTDLRHLVDITADAGGGIVGLNPLHQLFPNNPEHISPYSPSCRAALNTLYIDVEALAEFHECTAAQMLVATPQFQARLRSLLAEELVNYPGVAEIKREVLDLLYEHFRERHLTQHSEHAQAFFLYRDQSGSSLERLARFEALQAHFQAENAMIWGWPVWPEAYRDPDGSAVASFAAEHESAVTFYAWLQYSADIQLGEAGRQSWLRGLGVGLYADLAVGANPGGAEVWGWQGVFAVGAYTGAPPDLINRMGQDWGLPPYIPHRLREVAYAPLIEVLRANMRHAGALRIDHAMCLTRLFWVPAGRPASEGAYVAYALDELLGIVALESWRNQCLVIGEVLGTVPDGLRAWFTAADFLSYQPFIFERNEDGGFAAPGAYPHQALVAASTHDLPTLAGFWKGNDLDRREALKLFPSQELHERFVVERAQDRALMLLALEHEDLLPEGASVQPVAVMELTTPFINAIHAYLARTPSMVLVIQPEDIFGIVEQANLPGTRENQHPNWSRRMPLDLEDWCVDERFKQATEVVRRERGSAVIPQPEQPANSAAIPRATYRLQFNKNFTFAQAVEIVPYLAKLGITHCYASPYLKARPGSSHGYDVVDHGVLNPEIGTQEDYERFVAVLHEHGMGQIIDVVPNHMGVMGGDNAWWLDVLENGPAAAHANCFDIDWDPLNPDIKGKVLLPLLGDHYAAVLERGEIHLEFDSVRGEFSLFYYQHRMPIDPATYPLIILHRYARLVAVLGETDESNIELQTLLTAFARLPPRIDSEPSRIAERQRDKEVYKHHLATLVAASPDIAQHIRENLNDFNGRPGDTASFDALHALIQAQGYRLAFWRIASHEINYRRFFDINDLAALRMEEPDVFEATHRFVLDLVKQGKVNGLRIDHPDGLYNPGEYFSQLQSNAQGKAIEAGEPLPLYLVIEKILAERERLPLDWPIHGATGYQFSNLANSLFIDPSSKRRMTRIYERFIGESIDFEALVYRAKHLVMNTALVSELNVLAYRLARIAAMDRHTCDFTLYTLRDALAEVVACFPVYRTYVNDKRVSANDRSHIEGAIAVAKKRNPSMDSGIFNFVQGVLSTDIAHGRPEAYRSAVIFFAMKFQQFTSPVMAKGLEDTSFYRYHRLVSLNDVGGEPSRFGISVAAYHAATRARAKRWPHNLLATSTHDSKRSEDLRTRINVLSEIPTEWKLLLKRWSRINQPKKQSIDGAPAPSANDEYLLYQTLIGSWPLGDIMIDDLDTYRLRIEAYMIKAVREAKEHSSWININTAYEAALSNFIVTILTPGDNNLFLTDFERVMQRITHHGLLNSLSLMFLKLTSPGVPDIYQGCELWQFNLVDPDNRRSVDFALRGRLLDELREMENFPVTELTERLRILLDGMADGRAKLYLIWRTLALRAQKPELFREGDYQSLTVRGERSNHICAYARRHGNEALIAVAPRLTVKLLDTKGEHGGLPLGHDIWRDTSIDLPKELRHVSWHNVYTQETLPSDNSLVVAKILGNFPVALLVTG